MFGDLPRDGASRGQIRDLNPGVLTIIYVLELSGAILIIKFFKLSGIYLFENEIFK